MKRQPDYVDDLQMFKKLKALDKRAFSIFKDKYNIECDIKSAYLELKKLIKEKHNVTDPTISRDLAKLRKGKTPGIRKERKDAGIEKKPVSKKKIKEVKELIQSGGSIQEAKRILKELHGDDITNHEMNKIIAGLEDVEDDETSFGSEGKKLIEKIFQHSLMGDENVLTVKLNGKKIQLNKEDIADVMMPLATAYNRHVSGESSLDVDRIAWFKIKLYHFSEELLNIAMSKNSIKDAGTLSLINKRLEVDSPMTADYIVLKKCIRSIDPTITEQQIIAMVKKHSGYDKA